MTTSRCARCGHTTPECTRCGKSEPLLGGRIHNREYCHTFAGEPTCYMQESLERAQQMQMGDTTVTDKDLGGSPPAPDGFAVTDGQEGDLVTLLVQAIDDAGEVARSAFLRLQPETKKWHVAGQYGTEVRDAKDHLVVKHSWPNEIAHIIRNDPDAVLRRCVADRKLLDLHRAVVDGGRDPVWPAPGHCAECWTGEDYQPFPCATVRLLADGYGITQPQDADTVRPER